MNEALNDIQFAVLDAVYFVEPYENIINEVEASEPVVRDELRNMIDKGWIHVMIFNKQLGDFEKSRIYDTDNMQEYAYLASKDGLMKHNL